MCQTTCIKDDELRKVILNAQPDLDTILEIKSTSVYKKEVGVPCEMQRKSQIVQEIAKLISAKHLTPQAASNLMDVELAHLLRIQRGQFRDIDEPKLLEMLNKLGAS